MNLDEKLREFADIIKRTREFCELKQAKAVVESKSDLSAKVAEFREKDRELFLGKYSGEEVRIRAARLNQLFEVLAKIPEVERLLKAEKEFSEILQSVYKSISGITSAGLKS